MLLPSLRHWCILKSLLVFGYLAYSNLNAEILTCTRGCLCFKMKKTPRISPRQKSAGFLVKERLGHLLGAKRVWFLWTLRILFGLVACKDSSSSVSQTGIKPTSALNSICFKSKFKCPLNEVHRKLKADSDLCFYRDHYTFKGTAFVCYGPCTFEEHRSISGQKSFNPEVF